MSLKKRILSFFTAFLMIFGSTPFVFENASAEVGDDAPANEKNIKDNEDGTYTISLSVKGATSSDSTTSVNKANVVLVVDTSNSMNGRSGGYGSISRLAAEKDALTEDDGIIDKLVGQNVAGDPVKSDIIEVAIVNFGTRGTTAQDWTTSATTLKNTINSLETSTGTNWEEALSTAKSLADAKKTAQPNEDTFIIFLTDGEPTTHNNSYNVNTDYATEWGYAKDDARGIVTAGHKFYALFTWGSGTSSHYLSSLVQYAYAGDGNSNSTLSSDYAQYFTDASDTATLVSALTRIVNEITTGVGYTNIELTDGVTEMTHSNIKATASGEVSGLKYYRSGGDYSTTANDGLGEEWTDAPKATINENGEVDWDLDDLVLENGVTYTISFIVWPSQESLDLVADLNNGKVSYDSLSEDQKSQIIENGGKYTLKTNTDYPTLTYSTITTTTVNGQTSSVTSDPKTVNIENPDPVGLKDSKLTVEKLWEDGLDPTQRKDYAGKVVLDFYRGEEVYKSDITLNEENNWKLVNYIAIAPGIMVSSSSEAYDYATQYTDDSEYAILEEGHDYHFTEPDKKNQTETGEDKGKHFNLTKADYHPMLVDGTLMNVFYHRNEDGKIVIDSMEELTELTATNEVKGGALIEKVLVGNDGETALESSDTFKFNAELKNSDGTNYGEFAYRVYYGENNPNYGVNDSNTITDPETNEKTYRSEKKTATDSLSIELYGGDRVMLTDLRTGAYFWADEDDSNLKIGYEQLEETNQIVRDGGEAETDATTKEFDGKTFYAIEGNASTQYIAKNAYYTGALKISKTVTVESGNEEAAKAKTFNFTATIKDGEKTIKTETCELKHGESCEIKDLPAGATYEVSETEVEGFTMSSENETGTIEKEEEGEEPKTAAFTNTYKLSGSEATITVKKDFGNFWHTDLESGLADTFIFILKDSKGEVIGRKEVTETLKDSVKFIVPIEINEKIDENGKTFNFTITEDENFTRGGISRVENDEDIEVAIVAKDDGKGGITFEEAELSKDTIYNTYEATGSLTLQAKKVLEGREWLNSDKFSFELKNEDGEILDTAEVSMKDVEDEVADFSFEELEFTEADAGKTYTYTISETGTLPAGVENTTGDITVTVEISDNYDGTLTVTAEYSEENQTFINEYSTKATDAEDFVVKVSKEIVDDSEDQTAEDTEFAFIIKGLCEEFEDYSETIYVTTEDLIGSGAFSGISFDEVGEYQFEVSEVNDEKEYFEYDTSTYVVTVAVEDDYETAQLYIASKTVDEEEKEEIDLDFENHYNEPGRGEVEEPEETETNPYTRDNISLFISLYIISLIGFVGAIVYAKKRI